MGVVDTSIWETSPEQVPHALFTPQRINIYNPSSFFHREGFALPGISYVSDHTLRLTYARDLWYPENHTCQKRANFPPR